MFEIISEEILDNIFRTVYDERGLRSLHTDESRQSTKREFFKWCALRCRVAVPVEVETLVMFINDMRKDHKPSTVLIYLANIKWLHKAGGVEYPINSVSLMVAMKRLNKEKSDHQEQTKGMTRAMVDRVLSGYDSCYDNDGRLKHLRTAALLAVGYDTLARRSQLVALLVSDIKWSKDVSGFALINGTWRYLAEDTMFRIKRWINASGITDGALFRATPKGNKVGSGALTGKSVTRFYQDKDMAKAAGINLDGISSHSTRVGGCQDLTAAGCSVAEMQRAGGWKSPMMPARYGGSLSVKRGAMAKLAAMQGR